MKSFSNSKIFFGKVLLFLLPFLFGGLVQANNIRILGKPKLTNRDDKTGTVMIKFDIAWDNSWRTSKPANYDAAWIFVKCWDGESWNHVYLEKDGAIPGSVNPADAVVAGTKYYVSNQDGTVTNMPMKLEPGYSYAWKKWHVDPTEDSVQCVVGYFLYRQNYGAGHVVVPGVGFKWNFGSQGFVEGDDLVVKVFAVEMVYVPEGPYYLGGTGTATSQPNSFTTNGNTFGTPMVVTSEKAITIKNSTDASTLYTVGGTATTMPEGTLPEAFPKGYQAFYIMKYEMSQGAYAEFLNTLNQGQQDGLLDAVLANLKVGDVALGGVSYRSYIEVSQAAPVVTFGCDANNNNKWNETNVVNYGGRSLTRNIDGQDVALSWVSMRDLLSYAEFAGLRPMTELEYEKACRGPLKPVNDEFAWGSVTRVFFGMAFNTNYAQTAPNYWNTNIVDMSKGTERVGAAYNCGFTRRYYFSWWANNRIDLSTPRAYYTYPAPLRVGIFADSTSTRAAAGATYWGVMNMSDNVAEMCISTAGTAGRAFHGVHGSGQIDGNGMAQCAGWAYQNVANYFIFRGMQFRVYWQNVTTYTSTMNKYVNYNQVRWGDGNKGSTSNAAYYLSGMVSNRSMAAHKAAPTLRSESSGAALTTEATKPMAGIRCVRTANAAR